VLVQVPGGEASVEVVPGGQARLLWFEGGPGFNAGLGRPDVELLSERVTAYLIDAPGAGGSTPPASEQGYTAAATAAFYEQVRRALGLGRVTVAGHSWGGTVALCYAAAFPEACQRCLAISSSAGTFVDETDEAVTFHDAAFARHTRQPWFEDARAAFDSYGDPAIDDPRVARDRFSAAWPLYFANPGAAGSRHHIERLRREFTLDPAAARAAMRLHTTRRTSACCPRLPVRCLSWRGVLTSSAARRMPKPSRPRCRTRRCASSPAAGTFPSTSNPPRSLGPCSSGGTQRMRGPDELMGAWAILSGGPVQFLRGSRATQPDTFIGTPRCAGQACSPPTYGSPRSVPPRRPPDLPHSRP